MADYRLSQNEANRLLNMLKRSIVNQISIPSPGKGIEFEVIGDAKNDVFAVSIYRGKLQAHKFNISGRIKKHGILLLELHISPTAAHANPDGQKIVGDHWHIYSEEYGRAFAFPAENIHSPDFVENTIKFLTEFNVVKRPQIIYQVELTES
ncbi:DUF6978 family protein [Acutalibacter sp. 1XD8-36]|uniref:DUF6978 family protein n=1 Tax=Acutalibacter sp. 1XD8-36 TaxID=2320852 RepID=UPI0026064329|nr:hypothetical protein [Acutalibacter sp. 1XD8-36]